MFRKHCLIIKNSFFICVIHLYIKYDIFIWHDNVCLSTPARPHARTMQSYKARLLYYEEFNTKLAHKELTTKYSLSVINELEFENDSSQDFWRYVQGC